MGKVKGGGKATSGGGKGTSHNTPVISKSNK